MRLSCISSHAAAAPASAALIRQNFETGYGSFQRMGQVVRANGADYAPCCSTNPSDPNYNNYFAAFGGGQQPSGILSRPFRTINGVVYDVGFDYGALGSGVDRLTVKVGTVTMTYDPVASNDPISFTHASFTFVGDGNPVTLSFESAGTPNVDAIVDNIVVAGVPEPGTWAMMIFGFGMVGGTLRRRAKVRSTVSFA